MARMGGRVTGVDISGESIKQANHLNSKLGLDCNFINCNVYDTRRMIKGEFDLIFTSFGAICWLPDLDLWFEVIHASLKSGGIFYMVEFHPALYMFEFPDKTLKYHYFNKTVYEDKLSGTYADKDASIEMTEYFWNHSIHEILQPFIRNKYEILLFQELDYSPYNCFEHLKERKEGEFIYNIGIEYPHLIELKVKKSDHI